MPVSLQSRTPPWDPFWNSLHISMSFISDRLSLELISVLSCTLLIHDFTYIISVKPIMIMCWKSVKCWGPALLVQIWRPFSSWPSSGKHCFTVGKHRSDALMQSPFLLGSVKAGETLGEQRFPGSRYVSLRKSFFHFSIIPELMQDWNQVLVDNFGCLQVSFPYSTGSLSVTLSRTTW